MSPKLSEYNRKRDFDKTAEPAGDIAQALPDAPPGGLRFAVQHHLARKDHYDLRLEWDGALLSWAVPKGPSYNPRDRRLAVRVEAHPMEYRHFEGTIPQGEYGGGTVMLWDEGTWEPLGDAEAALSTGSLKFILKGRRLKGGWALVRLREKAGEDKDNWLLLKEKDAYAGSSDGISGFVTSVRTGRTMAEIENGEDEKLTENPFQQAEVQLLKRVGTPPAGGGWLFELKYDGYRILAFIEGGQVRLVTRNGNDFTRRFQSVADALADWAAGRAMVLDGELAVTDEAGKTDFLALQHYMKKPGDKSPTYIVFDLLALDGEDLRGRRLLERKEALEALIKGGPRCLYYSPHVAGNGGQSFRAACEAGMEGIVGKRADSVYSGTRNGDWIKLKCDTRQEFVVGGYTRTDKKTRGVSALLLGVYEGPELIYVGRAGTGFTERLMKDFMEKSDKIKTEDPPFRHAPRAGAHEEITWLEPRLVAEIKFTEWTSDGLLRQASFKGLREDKNPRDITREDINDDAPAGVQEESMIKSDSSLLIEGVKITSPDKLIFDDPAVTKADVVRYYAAISKRMLPYVKGRILSIVRCPKGISETCFYKKHPGPESKGIVTVPVLGSTGETEEYFYVEDTAGLVSEAQMGTLEFHTWGSRANTLEQPDIMVFDLDPDEGMALTQVRQGVMDIKSILEELSLVSFLKTSGGKGYHVIVPFIPSVSWAAFHDFARRVAEVMAQRWPDRYTANVRKNRRTDKIFIDWMRNGRGATSIAPYSLRARKGARVSMPIAWEALDAVAPDAVTMADALAVAGGPDPWRDFFSIRQGLR